MSRPPEESYWTLDPDPDLRNKYVVGDEIEAYILIHHRPNLGSIKLVFRHVEDEVVTITLSGDEPAVMNEVFLAPAGAISTKKSELKLSAKVTLDHILGSYELARLVLYTVGGQEITYEREAALDFGTDALDEFVVVPEPDAVSDPLIMTSAQREESQKRHGREPE